jgi:hypothetical protein
MAKKTTCPITRKDFQTHAKPLTIKIGELSVDVPAKEFSTGSLGWGLLSKTTMEINGTAVPVQIGMNITLVGSKDLPKEGGAASAG